MIICPITLMPVSHDESHLLTDQAFIWDRRLIPAEEMIQPTTRCKLLISAVTHGGVHLFLHHPDHFAGHTLMACPFADDSSPHVYVKLLTSLLPPSTRQPGPDAVVQCQWSRLLS